MVNDTLAIAATFTAEPIEPTLTFWIEQLGLKATIEFAPYGQTLQSLLDPGSAIGRNQRGLNVVLVRMEDWRPSASGGRRFDEVWSDPASTLTRGVDELVDALRTAAARRATSFFVCVCPPSVRFATDGTIAPLLRDAEARLAAAFAHHTGVSVLSSASLLATYPVSDYDDPHGEEIGHVPYTPAMFAAIATGIARRFFAVKTAAGRKVIAVDCDDTLWEGICGEVGPDGVVIDAARTALQAFLVEQQQHGMLICLCSKNNPADVHAVFDTREMPLARRHIVAERINWQPKSANIRELAAELQLGLDSFVFLDDSAVECAEVRASCPEVLTLQLPQPATTLPDFLAHSWAFDRLHAGTAEDQRRTDMYRENVERETLRRRASTLADFLASLDLRVRIAPPSPGELPRVAQLTERTNQFNASTIRRSEREIAELCADGTFHCLAVHVADRFGEYGLVGVVLYAEGAGGLDVDTFLLSCRVLGRGVEHRILAELGAIAERRGLGRVEIRAITTARNRPMLEFLDRVGSDVRQEIPGGFLYRFSAAGAQDPAERVLAAAVETVDSTETAVKPVAPLTAAPSEALRRIATDLRAVEDIVHAVAEWRLARSAPGPEVAAIDLPASPIEETVAKIWRDLLAHPSIDRHANFFALGGDSLTAAQSVARLRQALGVRLPLRAVFETPTIAALAERLSAAQQPKAPAVPALRPVPRDGEAPLSFAQQRFWFVEQLEPGSSYNPSTGLRLTGALDVASLSLALNEVVRRHESLRTTFASHGGVPVQVIAASRHQTLEVREVAAPAVADREREAFRLASAAAQQPFDLANGPLLRTVLFRIEEREHLLLVAMHHIVSDGWSLSVLTRELIELYNAFARQLPSSLPPLPVQYADFATWQRAALAASNHEEQLAYWQGQLADLPTLLEVPADRPRPPAQTHRGGHYGFSLPRGLSARLRQLSQEHGSTLFMTLLAGLEALVARYTGQQRFIVSTVVANRPQREAEALIGCLINVLPLRADVSGDPSFASLLARVRETASGAQAHQDVPFEQIVDRLQPERDLRYNPLTQVMLVLLGHEMEERRLDDLAIRQVDIDNAATAYDIVIHVREHGERLGGFVHYSADIFDAETIGRFMAHFERLLDAAVDDPSRPVAALPILTAEERQTILVDWNRTEQPFDADRPLHELVAQQAARTPDALAVVFGNEQLTYRELDRRSNQLAHALRERGVGQDGLVALAVERSLDMVVGMLGILKAGGAYVPLDPAFPKSRLEFMLADASVRVLVTERRLAGELPLVESTVLIDADWPQIAGHETTAPPPVATAGDLAYVIYTSGSTGVPKGVEIPHRAVVNFLESMQGRPGLRADDRLVAVTTLSFDIAGLEIWLPLITGATVIVASREVATDGAKLRDLLDASKATIMQATPSTWRLLLDAGWRSGTPLTPFTALCGGEAFPAPLAAALGERVSSLWNMYGPTETTIWSTIHPVDHVAGTIPLGKAIANTTTYVLDAAGQPVPFNVAGELRIGGVGVARGYRNRPELTAEKFVTDLYASDEAARVYRTGDLARYRADGTLEYLGRLDHQVKIRGYRIELGEIEAALDAQPAVRQSAAIAREDGSDKQLVAYVVAAEGAAINVSELRRALRERLPEHMVPSVFVTLDELPLTANGKIDRKSLPAPDQERPALDDAYVAPRTPDEEQLAAIWAQVLRVDRPGIHDNFFDLGGHSIAVTQVVSRVAGAFGVELPLRTVFEEPTIAGQAGCIAALRGAATGGRVPALVPVPRTGELPLSYAQHRLWFIDQLDPGNSVYNLPGAFWIDGPLNVPALELSLAAIVSRHETQRTSFPSVGGQPVQAIARSATVPLVIEDLRSLPAAAREPAAQRLADAEARRPFDVANGPLLRTTLVRIDEERHLLLLTTHHIVSDGWSLEVFNEELAALYGAFSAGRPSPLPPLDIQYLDFVAWQRACLDEARLAAEASYWQEHLAGVPTFLSLPADRPRPPVQSFSGRQRRFTLPRELAERLNEVGRREGTTLFMTMMSALQVLLHRYSGQEQFIVSTGAGNRTSPELERLIGCLINVVLLKADLGDNPTFRTLLQRVREEALSAYAHQDLPFEKLVEALRPERDLSYHPLTQVMFVLLRGPMDRLELPGLDVAAMEVENLSCQYDLVLHVWETNEGLAGFWHFNSDIFDISTIDRMVGHLEKLLTALTANIDARILEAPMLTAREAQAMLVDWNATAHEFPDGTCLHELFEHHVALNPDAPAIFFGERSLTYGEVEAQANQLAHALRRRGVGPDRLVGLCVERSIHLVIGVLGILKAGGAYVPLDPAYPEERLRMMLDDSQTSILLTQTHLIPSLPHVNGEIIALDEPGQFATEPTTKPESGVGARHLSYVIYTSGSTGMPKGIALEHRGVVNNIVDLNWRHGVGPADRVLALSSLSFDMCVYEVLGTLEAGGAIVMPLPEEWREPGAWARLARRHHVSVWNSAPQLLKMLVDYVEDKPDLWPVDLHLTILGGDWVPVSLPDRLKAIAPKVRVIVLGGATEASIHSIIFPVEKTDPSWKSIPYGVPMWNQKSYILNTSLQPVPVGVPGELFLGGIGLGRGYFQRPEQTAERFLPSPFVPGERIYRTGDLARYGADGVIELLGRIDYQVKLRGLRIECGEIESTVLQHPAVREIVVVAKDYAGGDKRLIGYVRPSEQAAAPLVKLLAMEKQGALRDIHTHDLPNGLVVVCHNNAETDFGYSEIFENDDLARLGIRLDDRSCVFDVGANIGLFSLKVHKQWPGARVFAFEPVGPVYDLLAKNLDLYDVNGKALNVGLAARAATEEITYYPHLSLISSRFADTASDREVVKDYVIKQQHVEDDAVLSAILEDRLEPRILQCEMKTLSQVIREQGVERIDLLKIDTERGELDVLAGIEDQDWQKIRQLIVEVYRQGDRLDFVTSLLARHGFRVEVEQHAVLSTSPFVNVCGLRDGLATAPAVQTEPSHQEWARRDLLSEELREYARAKLPDYMVPTAFVFVPELPLSPNGKVDRKALVNQALTIANDRVFVAPTGPTEETIARIFGEVLGAAQVGIHDNFFDLGGHSLLAAQVVAQVGKAFGLELPLRRIFEAPTVAALAQSVEQATASGSNQALTAISVVPRTGDNMLSYAQEGLWFVHELVSKNTGAYNIAPGIRLKGPLDEQALEHAVAELMARHEVLRSTFPQHDEHPVQVAGAVPAVPLIVDDVSHLSAAEQEREAARIAQSEARYSFDLATGPLVRARLVRFAAEDHLLTLTFHHIVTDGWSLDVVVRDLGALYNARLRGTSPDLPALPVQFIDFATWERQWVPEHADRFVTFWRNTLAGAPPFLDLPADRPRPKEQTLRGARFHFRLPVSVAERIEEAGRGLQASPFMVLLAAFNVFLSLLTDRDDIIVGSPFANRVHKETHNLVGPFVNTLPLRLRVPRVATFRRLIEDARESVLAVEAHQSLPFDQIVAAIKPPRDLSRNAIFQVNFRVLVSGPFPLELTGLDSTLSISEVVTSKFDLALELCPAPSGMTAFFEYSTDLFDESTIRRLAGQFERLTTALLGDSDRPIAEVPVVRDLASAKKPAAHSAIPGQATDPSVRGKRRRGVRVEE